MPIADTPPRPARREDLRLITGGGDFVADRAPPGTLFAAFARSMHARARLVRIDAAAARRTPGCRLVALADDVAGLTLPGVNPLLAPAHYAPPPLLPRQDVHAVGQPLALVVADSPAAAQAAAEAVQVEIEELPARPDLAEGAPRVFHVGHRTGEAPAEIHRVQIEHVQARVAPMPMEPRAAVAAWSAGRLTAWLPVQSPARARDDLAQALGLPREAVRVITPDVGGAFGGKATVGAEELLVAWAARRLGATVKWTATRSEDFAFATQGRGARLEGSLGLDADGHFTRLAARLAFPLGGWLPYSAAMPVRNAARILPGPYRVAAVDIDAEAVQSDTAPVNIYRGAGRPEAALLMESLIDTLARKAGMDPVALRRRNLIAAGAMPCDTPTGERLDSGDYAALLERACERFDYETERTGQRVRRAAGELVGLGVAMYVEPCGQGWESARVTLLSDGRVEVASGSAAQGQGHETTYATLAAAELGCTPENVTVVHGDTDACPDGIGALASRSMAIGGSAIAVAAREAAERRSRGEALPLTAEAVYRAPGEAWSAGCVMLRLAIDVDTGVARIERAVWVDDAGRILSPTLALGQLHGGFAQGLGQALLERIVYDDAGQLLTGSLMDYALPRAADMPRIDIESLANPATANLLGVKGVGEAGTIGVPAAIFNAVADALSPLGEARLDFPLTPERLWRTIRSLRETTKP